MEKYTLDDIDKEKLWEYPQIFEIRNGSHAIGDESDNIFMDYRNEIAMDIAGMAGFGDNAGSGFPSLLATWKEEGRVKPEL